MSRASREEFESGKVDVPIFRARFGGEQQASVSVGGLRVLPIDDIPTPPSSACRRLLPTLLDEHRQSRAGVSRHHRATKVSPEWFEHGLCASE